MIRTGSRVIDNLTGVAGKVIARVNWDRTYYKVLVDGSEHTIVRTARDLTKEA